jgi:dienelactone hydrolase
MMHRCGGAYAREGSLNAGHRMWGELLASQGDVALTLDSFSSRRLGELCAQSLVQRTRKEAHRRSDSYAAPAFLRGRVDVDAARIALLGWSHGGGRVLATIGTPPKGGQGAAAAVAFCPGCTARRQGAAEPPSLRSVAGADRRVG